MMNTEEINHLAARSAAAVGVTPTSDMRPFVERAVKYALTTTLAAGQTQQGIERRKLDWAPVVEGGRDIQSKTEFGSYVISIDSSFAGGTHYLWTPDQREYDDDHHSEYRSKTAALNAAQADYENRIRVATPAKGCKA